MHQPQGLLSLDQIRGEGAAFAAEAAALERYLGGLHDFRPGRPSLACDLVEPAARAVRGSLGRTPVQRTAREPGRPSGLPGRFSIAASFLRPYPARLGRTLALLA